MLFQNFQDHEFIPILACLRATIACYNKGEMPLVAGDQVSAVGIILSGQMNVIREDINGNRMIVTELRESDLFGETFACVEMEHIPITVVAMTHCEVMWVDYHHIIADKPIACGFQSRLIGNMLRLIALKNIKLNHRLEILSKRSIRERLVAYLELQAEEIGKRVFQIPFDRNKLADYLCTDRSALSRELGRMRDEGLLEFEKNTFKLL